MSTLDPTIAAPLPVGAVTTPSAPGRGGIGSTPMPVRDPEGLRVIGAQSEVPLSSLFGELMAHRDLMFQLAARDVRIRYKQAVMGFAWSVLMPLLIVGAGTLMRIAVATITGVQLDRAEIGAVVLKSFPWAFFAGAIGFGVQSVTANIGLVTKIYFPRAILPIAVVLGNMFDLLVGLGALLLVMPFLGATLSAALLWAPILIGLLVVLTAGLSTVLACANLFFRDVKYLTQVILTFGVFFTPILFDAGSFGARGAKLLMLNPLAPIFEGLRLSVIDGHNLLLPATQVLRGVEIVAWQPWYLLYSAVWAFGSLALGLVLFQRTQDLFAEFA